MLADFVEVDPAYEKATEEFLHEELEYVVVKDWSEAERGIDLMRTELDGRATFLVECRRLAECERRRRPARQPPASSAASAIIVRFTNGLTHAPRICFPRLANCYLAEDRAAAQRLAAEHPGRFFLLARRRQLSRARRQRRQEEPAAVRWR